MTTNPSDSFAVVTGASGGIGSEICRGLAAMGYRLILVERSKEKAQAFAKVLNREYPGSTVDSFAADLSRPSDNRGVAARVLEKYPSIELLINNAGVLTEDLQFSSAGNELHFQVNTLAPLQWIDGLTPALKASGGAIVVSTSAGIAKSVKELSLPELRKPTSFKKLFGPYVKSKQALNVLSAALAHELEKDAIVVRTADPGPTKTRLTKGPGTPLWMRLFYFLLPSPAHGASHILAAANRSAFKARSGVFISGGKIVPLPTPLASEAFQRQLLTQCRELVAEKREQQLSA